MSAPAIFVSHSHKDDAYCRELITTLRAAGLDVWYDEHNASAGHLRSLIERELRQRPIFVVVLSPAALESQWVSDECDWAYSLYRKDPTRRVILPVLAETVNEDDIWLFMQQFKRVEQPGLLPWPVTEAARRVALAIDPNAPLATAHSPTPPPATPAPSQTDELDALMARANALVSQGKRRDAIEVLRRATTLAPRSVAAWNTLGLTLTYLDLDSAALEAFERVLLLEPDNAVAWAGKTNALAIDHPQQALLCANKALTLDPKSMLGLNGKNLALFNLGRFQESLDTCERILDLDPNLPIAWSNKGNALYSLGRYQEALDAYDHALALERNAKRWSGKGNALYSLGRFREALDAYDRALAIDPDDVYTWQGKTATLRKLGRNREANEAERKAKELEGKK